MGLRLYRRLRPGFRQRGLRSDAPVTLRGTIETMSADGRAVTMKTRAGEAATVRVKPDRRSLSSCRRRSQT